jgi:hypothetical protein
LLTKTVKILSVTDEFVTFYKRTTVKRLWLL